MEEVKLTTEEQIDTVDNEIMPLRKPDLNYGLEDIPPWYMCAALGFQHYLTMFGSTLAVVLIVCKALCLQDDYLTKAEIMGTILFVSGLGTLIQSTLGTRLPIIQGGTFAYLPPLFAILSLPKWKCSDTGGVRSVGLNLTLSMSNHTTWMNDTEVVEAEWMEKMREIQGAIILASLFQVVIGLSGAVGILMKYIGPLVIAPTIALIGVALFEATADFCAVNWWIAFLTMALIALFSQYLRRVNLPICGWNHAKGFHTTRSPFFQLFPVMLAVVICWLFCGVLTWSNALPDDPSSWGYRTRVDIKSQVLLDAKWFRFPYPFQWGWPTCSLAGVFGMLSGVIAGIIESVGDYYACARLSGAPPPPVHAINRGIFVEGVGCVLAGIWGTGNGMTSYSENIGAIGITKVASRRVVQTGAMIMMGLGILSKFGALFVTIPEPIVGGVFMVMFGIITAVGISNLQFVDLNSSRNLFVFGFSLMFGLSFPRWITHNPIQLGRDELDRILTVLLSTSMFVGGMVAFILDNTIPGTAKERGLHAWKSSKGVSGEDATSCYNIPVIGKAINRWTCSSYIPICPTFMSSSETDKKETSKRQKDDSVYVTEVTNI